MHNIHPKKISGKFRRIKSLLSVVLLSIFVICPFLTWDRGEYIINQAVMVDLKMGIVYFFFFKIWFDELIVIAILIVILFVLLLLVTNVYGRIWCGFSCPQTVFTDIFMGIEYLIQGDRNKRLALDQRKWGLEKIAKKSLTHISWLFICTFVGFIFILYFQPSYELIANLSEIGGTNIVVIVIIALTWYILAGIAREKFCLYMCPYSKFQSVLYDKKTTTVYYQQDRGEPRKIFGQKKDFDDHGHCVDCNLCVNVCPAGIDIRDGIQLACISCGLCIDACNGVMDKLQLPNDLITYGSPYAEQKAYKRFMKPVILVYILLISVFTGIISYIGINFSDTDVVINNIRNPLFIKMSDFSIRNKYEVKLTNKGNKPQHYTIESLPNNKEYAILVSQYQNRSIQVQPHQTRSIQLFVTSKELRNDDTIIIKVSSNNTSMQKKLRFFNE